MTISYQDIIVLSNGGCNRSETASEVLSTPRPKMKHYDPPKRDPGLPPCPTSSADPLAIHATQLYCRCNHVIPIPPNPIPSHLHVAPSQRKPVNSGQPTDRNTASCKLI